MNRTKPIVINSVREPKRPCQTEQRYSVMSIQQYHKGFEDLCVGIDREQVSGADRLSELINQCRVSSSNGAKIFLCASIYASRDRLPNEALENISQFRNAAISWITDVFDKGSIDGSIPNVITPQLEAVATLSLLEGAQLAACSEENIRLFDEAVKLLRMRIAV